ncbi:chlorohydrolase [Streptococcus pneumoniae]|nr:chlorohydrolase [Streptococcus pneumoniae]VQU15321.1 chlorohydrolase [Streptococcus pneumoniae]
MKIKEQTRKLAAGCSKHCFEVVDETDEVSNHTYGKATLTWFEEIFEEYNMNLIYEAISYETWLQLEKGE